MNPTHPGGENDALRALDERLALLVARLRDLAGERDALLREIEELRARSAGSDSAARGAAAASAAWLETAGQVGASLRSALEELRAD